MIDLTNAEKREVFIASVEWHNSLKQQSVCVGCEQAEKEALRRYPDPTPQPPRMTLREIQLQREGFMACAQWLDGADHIINAVAVNEELERRYPYPYEPTVVRLSDGRNYRIGASGVLKREISTGLALGQWQAAIAHVPTTPSDLVSLGQIAQEYYERTK